MKSLRGAIVAGVICFGIALLLYTLFWPIKDRQPDASAIDASRIDILNECVRISMIRQPSLVEAALKNDNPNLFLARIFRELDVFPTGVRQNSTGEFIDAQNTPFRVLVVGGNSPRFMKPEN